MLGDTGGAVMIDFDSCLPIGQEIAFRKEHVWLDIEATTKPRRSRK
jgi:hypothetical protein